MYDEFGRKKFGVIVILLKLQSVTFVIC